MSPIRRPSFPKRDAASRKTLLSLRKMRREMESQSRAHAEFIERMDLLMSRWEEPPQMPLNPSQDFDDQFSVPEMLAQLRNSSRAFFASRALVKARLERITELLVARCEAADSALKLAIDLQSNPEVPEPLAQAFLALSTALLGEQLSGPGLSNPSRDEVQ